MRQISLAFLLLTATAVHADVTLRYKSAFQWAKGVPQQMIDQSATMMSTTLKPESVIRARRDKAYSDQGPFRSIVDLKTKQMTIIDTAGRRYAKADAQQVAEQMSKFFTDLPPEAKQAMAMMKVTSDSKLTGRTATIQGIEAEEREATMSIEGPPVPNMPPGPMIQMALQYWTAKPGQGDRFPALAEMETLKLSQYSAMDGSAMMAGMFQQMPGMGEGFLKFLKDRQAVGAVMLRMKVAMKMPGIAAMMKQLPPDKNPFGSAFDGDAPLFEMTQELAGISSDPIPDSAFEAPADFQEAPLADLLRDLMPKQGKPAAAPKQ